MLSVRVMEEQTAQSPLTGQPGLGCWEQLPKGLLVSPSLHPPRGAGSAG